MSRGLNKVMLIGNLGNAPETRKTTSGSTVTNVNIATSETWKDKDTGQLNEKTEWHRVIFFNRLADIVAQYCQKGSKLYIEGKLQTRKWQDKDGHDRYTTEIIANEMQMLDNKPSASQSESSYAGTTASASVNDGYKGGFKGTPQSTPMQSNELPPFDDDLEIPF